MKPGIQVAYAAARLAGWLRSMDQSIVPLPAKPAEPGISVVIPSRNGKALLALQMPGLLDQLPAASEVLVVDNGSEDGTAEWLEAGWPEVRVDRSREPLSFARAANRGIARARYRRVCLLNNDMLLDRGFFEALAGAFDQVPDLFCATAQIRFPAGVRRQETGKAVMAQLRPDDFPLRCDEPLAGEDLTYVLYGSGGCSLYDTARLRLLGGLDSTYEPAYVEDLDVGYRAWLRGWPSVYVADAQVEHRHRATTSRYYTSQELDAILELNYLKFLARAVSSGRVFRRLWAQAVGRLRLRAPHDTTAAQVVRQAAGVVLAGGLAAAPAFSEDLILALTNGTVWVFPGRPATGKPRMVLASRYSIPSFDRLRRAAGEHDLVLAAFTEVPKPPPDELLGVCTEIVLIERSRSASLCFRAALEQTVRKWRPVRTANV